MPEIIPEPFVLEDAVLEIESDDFAAAISAITVTPQTSTKTFKGLKRTARYSTTVVDSWQAAITLAQDWDDAASFANFLFDPANEGQTKAATLRPRSTGVGFTVDLVIVPPSIGGPGGDYTTSQVTLGVSGRPEKIAAPVGG